MIKVRCPFGMASPAACNSALTRMVNVVAALGTFDSYATALDVLWA
jgi:hypothetical protein